MVAKRENFAQSLRSQWLGQRIRAHRERHGLALQDVAPIIEREFSTLGAYERAVWPMPLAVMPLLLDVYGIVDERERDLLLDTARYAWRINQWDADTNPAETSLPVIDYSWAQARAKQIWLYGATHVPVLLQTHSYLEALVRAKEGDVLPEHRVANLIRERMALQEVLTARPPVQVRALVEESALGRPVGGLSGLRDQLEHLIAVSQQANVTVQVLPATVGEHQALDGSFTVLNMREDYPPVVYLEHLGGRMFLEAGRAARYVAAYKRLQELAVSPQATSAHLATLVAGSDRAATAQVS